MHILNRFEITMFSFAMTSLFDLSYASIIVFICNLDIVYFLEVIVAGSKMKPP